LDWLGVTLAGSTDPSSLLLKDTVSEFAGKKQATVVGHHDRTDVFSAALLNGYFSHVLDYDDIHLEMIGHPSVPVFPAILAASELRGADGKSFICAYAVGVEAECRIGEAVNPEHYDRGWHSTATLGHFGAAAGAAKILGLDKPSITNALGVAGTQASGLRQVFGTMCKPFHGGKAAADGLFAAVLAERGFTSSGDMIGGEKGFAAVLSDTYNPDGIFGIPGGRWHVDDIIFKRHASCYRTHAVIECALALRNRLDAGPDNIAKIELIRCTVHPLAWDMAGILKPENILEAKFCQPFCTAIALVTGKATKAEFVDDYILNEDIVRLIDKTTVEISNRLTTTEANVEIVLENGAILSEQIDTETIEIPEADIASDLEAKFFSLLPPNITRQKAEHLFDTIMNLEEVSDIRKVVRLLPVHA
jgi:2-methylcitrate dehydratase PrpD